MVSRDLFEKFVANALSAGAEVREVPAGENVAVHLAGILGKEGIRRLSVSEDARPLLRDPAGDFVFLPVQEPADFETSQAGIVRADYGVAETGTLVHLDLGDVEKMIWTLPPVCAALLDAGKIAGRLADLIPEISAHLEAPCLPGPQVSLVTGPSRTADIECQLSIGVHGPSRLLILLYGGPAA
ncbi:MAG: LUD domain-containing protein [Acidobacteriota bacterium]|nr:LUD domain-containing protein [Acidobacteriota bacterium]